MPPTSLPPGDPNNDYRARIKIRGVDDFGSETFIFVIVKVFPVSQQTEEDTSPVDLFSTLKNLTVGADGDGGKIKDLISDNNEQVALSVALGTAAVLNVVEDELSSEQQEELRNDLVDTLAAVPVKNTFVAQKQVEALNEVTKTTEQLSESATANAAELYENLGSFLEKRADESSSADTDVDNLEETALLVFEGSMKILKSASSQEKTDNTTSSTATNVTSVEKVKNVAKKTLGVIGGVVKALLKRRVAGDPPTEFKTDVLTLKVEKVDASTMKDGSFSTSGGGNFNIPGVDNLLSGKVGTDNAILDVQMTQAEENPYSWDPSSAKVFSDVISLEVNTGLGDKLPTDNLTNPATIIVPSAVLQKNTKQARSNLASASSLKDKEILVYTMTMTKTTQIMKLSMTLSPMKNTFVAIVTTDQPPAHDDFFRTGNATVKLFVCIKNGQPLSEVLGEKCDNPDPLDESAGWTYLLSGSSVSIIGRNVQEPEDDILVYVGCIALIHDQAETKRYLKTATSRSKRSTERPEDDDLDVFQVCEEEAPPSGISFIIKEPEGPLIYFDTVAASCLFWNNTSEKWSSEGCEVAYEESLEKLECKCTHLSSFGGKLLVAPNAVNPIKDAALFLTVFSNPISVVMVVTMWLLFAILGVWSRRADKADFASRGVTVLEDNHPRDTYPYLVTVITGFRDNAGTTSTVGIFITGEEGKSERHLLLDPKRKKFGTGCEDWFLLTTKESLGELKTLDVWLDFIGLYPSWFLREIIVRDLGSRKLWVFEHNAWIYPDENQKKISATLIAQSPTERKQHIKALHQLETRTTQDLRDKHLWISVFSLSPNSNFTRLQRLGCAFSFIFTAMLTNMMFYGVVPDSGTSGELAGFTFNYGQIIIAIQSSLITIPVNASLVWIFRNARLKPSQEKTVSEKIKEGIKKAQSVQRAAQALSEESLTEQLATQRKNIHGELMVLAEKLDVQLGDSLSSLSETSTDSSEFVLSPESSCLGSLEDIKIEKVLQDIGMAGILDPQAEKTMTKHFEEMKQAMCYPESEKPPQPKGPGIWFVNPVTKAWVNVNEPDDVVATLASVEACLPEESSTDSSISTLSSVPSSIIAMHFSENVNESNRADVDTFHDDRGDAYSIVDPIKPVEKEGSGTVDNNTSEIPIKKRRNNKTEGLICLRCCKRREDSDIEKGIEGDSNEKTKQTGIPWWTIYIAWTLCGSSILVSSYFIMLYGLKFGYEKSLEWLTSFFTSFFGSTVFFQPLKIFAVAAFFSCIMKSPLKVEYDSGNLTNPKLGHDEEYLESEPIKKRKREVVRKDPRYFVPSAKRIRAVNKRLYKEAKMKGFLWDLLILFIFTSTITVIVHIHVPTETYYVTKTVDDVLVQSKYADGMHVDDVALKDDIWEYLSTTLLPSVYNVPADESDEAQFYLSDLTTAIIGVPRIRQLRIDHGKCELPEKVKVVSAECFRQYSFSTEEKGDYGTAWTPLFENSTTEENSAWVYHSALELETTPIFAAHETYGGGGYVAELKSTRNKSKLFLEYWEDNFWIDRYTRAVIVELNTFHPPTHLFSTTSIVFEAHPTGAFTPFVQILTAKLYFYSNPAELMSIAFEINFVIFTIGMTIRELWKGCKQRKKYFEEPWNIIELAINGLSYAIIILYLQRIFLINRTLRRYKTGKCRNVFVSFYPAVLADHTLQYVMAALITFASVRYVRFLNLNKRVLVISMAIRSAFSTVLTYAFLLTAGIIMFSAAGVLVMGPFCAEMRSPIEAVVSIFHLILLETQFELDECAAFDITRVKGPLYVLVVGFVMVMIGVPLLQAILDFAVVSTRHNQKRIEEEYDILDFIHTRLKFWTKN